MAIEDIIRLPLPTEMLANLLLLPNSAEKRHSSRCHLICKSKRKARRVGSAHTTSYKLARARPEKERERERAGQQSVCLYVGVVGAIIHQNNSMEDYQQSDLIDQTTPTERQN